MIEIYYVTDHLAIQTLIFLPDTSWDIFDLSFRMKFVEFLSIFWYVWKLRKRVHLTFIGIGQ